MALPLLRPLRSTSIHPITKREICTGTLPAGTQILEPGERIRFAEENQIDQLIVRVVDAKGFTGMDRVDLRELVAALVDRLPVDNAPPTEEPVTVSGWYRLVDGTWGLFNWRNGNADLDQRVPTIEQTVVF